MSPVLSKSCTLPPMARYLYMTLMELTDHGKHKLRDKSQQDIADLMGISRATVNRLTPLLEAQGLIVVERERRDQTCQERHIYSLPGVTQSYNGVTESYRKDSDDDSIPTDILDSSLEESDSNINHQESYCNTELHACDRELQPTSIPNMPGLAPATTRKWVAQWGAERVGGAIRDALARNGGPGMACGFLTGVLTPFPLTARQRHAHDENDPERYIRGKYAAWIEH